MALSPHLTSMSAMSQDKLAELIIKSYVISDYVFQMLSETEESILCDCQRMAAAPNRAKGLSCKTTDCSSPVGPISQQLTLADRPNYPTAMAVIILEDPHRKHSVCVCARQNKDIFPSRCAHEHGGNPQTKSKPKRLFVRSKEASVAIVKQPILTMATPRSYGSFFFFWTQLPTGHKQHQSACSCCAAKIKHFTLPKRYRLCD